MNYCKGIIFDLDGVICSTDHYHYLAWKAIADQLGILFDEQFNQKLRGVSRTESLELILGERSTEYSASQKEALAEEKNRIYRSYLERMGSDDLDSDVRTTLSVLKCMGYRLAIGSSSKNAVLILSRLGLDGFFDAVADGTQVSKSKPHPEVFLLASKLLQLHPRDCIVVEDGDEYDGIMNYGVTKACLDLLAFQTIDSKAFLDRIVRLYHAYTIAANMKMLNLLGSHDTDRFLTRVKGDAQRFRTAAAIMFFYPGIPCVYYGDEIGMEGGYDPDCRRCFDWNEENWDKETRSLIQRLVKLKKEPALSGGRFSIEEKDGILTFTRTAPTQTLKLRVNGTDQVNTGLPAYGFEIIM